MFDQLFKFGAGLFMIAAGLWGIAMLACFISAIIVTLCAVLPQL